METQLREYKNELKKIVNKVKNKNHRDVLRMHLLGGLPVTTISVIRGVTIQRIVAISKAGLTSVDINLTPKELKEKLAFKYFKGIDKDKQ